MGTGPTMGEQLAAALEWGATADGPWPPPLVADLPPDTQQVLYDGVMDLRSAIAEKFAHLDGDQ